MKQLEIMFKNLFLNFLLLINPNKKSNANPVFNQNNKILFIRLNRIGDALVTTPLIHLVKEKLGCKVYILADIKNHFIFQNNPSIDEVLVFKKGLKGFFAINKFIKGKNIDTIIDLHDDVSTSVSFLIALSKVRYKFGLKRSNHSLFTNTIERSDAKINHVIVRLLKLAELFNIPVEMDSVSVRYYPSEEINNKALEQLQRMNPENKFLVGINISAGSKARFWGINKFKLLLNELSVYDVKPILFCTAEDLPLALQIGNENIIYPFTKGFDIFAAAVMKLDFLITPDTSIVQIASINKIPLFGIYVKYKTDDMLWTPFNTDFECVITEEPTLVNVTFEEVKNKFIPFLEKRLNAKRNSIL